MTYAWAKSPGAVRTGLSAHGKNSGRYTLSDLLDSRTAPDDSTQDAQRINTRQQADYDNNQDSDNTSYCPPVLLPVPVDFRRLLRNASFHRITLHPLSLLTGKNRSTEGIEHLVPARKVVGERIVFL